MPLVTVYMPTHNRAHMVERAVKSVLAQTHPDIELIIVDDGSSDGTWQLLQQYAQRTNIAILRNETPQGGCAARNRAIQQARGEFATGLDDDDEMLPNHIANLLNHYQDSNAFVAASYIEDTGQKHINRNRHSGKITLNSLLHYNKVGNQTLTRTERLKAVGGFDENLPAFQDYDLWVRLVASYGPALKLPTATYVLHTSHESRITHSTEKPLRALEAFIAKHRHLMTKAHLNSMEITRRRLAGEPFTAKDLLRYTNRRNAPAAIALYLNQNLQPLKRTLDTLRH